jgi:hypothetical protein
MRLPRASAATIALLVYVALAGCATGQASRTEAGSGAGGGGGEAPATCLGVSCHALATCSVVDGTPTCACLPGLVGDGLTCDDVDECASGAVTCGAHAACVNNLGSAECECDPGYGGDGAAGCDDVDECAAHTDDCDPNASCENAVGSFTCACDEGFVGDGKTCDDFDECAEGTSTCDPHATCQNTPGSYACLCDEGYAGSGFVCTDIDECAGGGASCDPNATCHNEEGSYACVCDAGYVGDGTTCDDVDECADGAACGPNATCANTVGSFVCACDLGFVLQGQSCVEVGAGEVSIEAGKMSVSSQDVTLYLQEPGNLLTNAGAESSDLSSWQIVAAGGDGWTTAGGGMFGASVFLTSYGMCRRSQLVDLLSAGYTQEELDAAPPIVVREWALGTWPNVGDTFYAKVELRTAANVVLAKLDNGNQPLSPSWQQVGKTFTGYGAGLRYVYFEDGGQDAEFWAGYYGASMDGASVTVGLAQARFSNDGVAWSAWAPFTPTADWTLAPGAGTKTVYVEFLDASGKIWPAVSDTILLQ